tara:strand:+ start:975 stop:1166 length:192 start_codon:yes stop_codon:yes gene_type:complete
MPSIRLLARSVVRWLVVAPMVGGMITAPLLSMFVIPAVYLLMRRRRSPQPAWLGWRRRSDAMA